MVFLSCLAAYLPLAALSEVSGLVCVVSAAGSSVGASPSTVSILRMLPSVLTTMAKSFLSAVETTPDASSVKYSDSAASFFFLQIVLLFHVKRYRTRSTCPG